MSALANTTTTPTATMAMAMATGSIRIDLGSHAWTCAKVEEVVPVLREIGAGYRAGAQALRDAKLRLGRALVQLRPQVKHGEWCMLLEGLGMNQRTVQAAMRRAEEWTDEQGKLDLDKVRARVADVARGDAGKEEQMRSALRISGAGPSQRQLDRLSGEWGGDGGDGDDDEGEEGANVLRARHLEDGEEGGVERGIEPGEVEAWEDEEFEDDEFDEVGDAGGVGGGGGGEDGCGDREGVHDDRARGAGGGDAAGDDRAGGGGADVVGRIVGGVGGAVVGVVVPVAGRSRSGAAAGRSEQAGSARTAAPEAARPVQLLLADLYAEARAVAAEFVLRLARGDVSEEQVRRVLAAMRGEG